MPLRDRPPHPVLRVVGWVFDVCGVVAALTILAAVLVTCQLIFVRMVYNASTVWQTEAEIYLMIDATFIGLPYVQRARGHVNVDLLPLMLMHPVRKALAVFTLVLAIVVLGVMLSYGTELWWMALQRGWRSDMVWGVPLWIAYLAMPLGSGLYVVQMLADLWAVASGRAVRSGPGGNIG